NRQRPASRRKTRAAHLRRANRKADLRQRALGRCRKVVLRERWRSAISLQQQGIWTVKPLQSVRLPKSNQADEQASTTQSGRRFYSRSIYFGRTPRAVTTTAIRICRRRTRARAGVRATRKINGPSCAKLSRSMRTL